MTTDRLVDYHCHLDLYPNHVAAFDACRDQAIDVLTVTTTPRAYLTNVQLAMGADNIRVGLGLHPQVVGTKEADIGLFESLASKAKFIGEVGLDAGPRFYKHIELQKQLFERVLKICALTGPKIISVHSVRSAGLILPMIDSLLRGSGCQVVFHWFSGSTSEAKRALEMGCWFSINSQMRNSASGKRIIAEIPLERILTETDGPFTESNPGVSAVPADVGRATQLIADLKGIGLETAQAAISDNLTALETILK